MAAVAVEGYRAPDRGDAARGPRATTWALVGLVALGVVLRCWQLGAHLYQFDEAFTAMVSRRSTGDLLSYLRHHDSHPPLDYLIRAPFARGGYSLVALRLPSVVFSGAALALFARWMRDRGWVGVIATALMAVNGFQIFFGREARMYALMELVGVCAAVLVDRWLRDPRPHHAALVGALVFVGALDHVTALVLAVGLFACAGLRRDRAAWRWRAGLGAGLLAWALVWGRAFVDQAGAGSGEWVPHTSLHSVVNAVGRVVTFWGGTAGLAVALVAAGGVCLWRRDRAMARVAFSCGVVPFGVLATIGLSAPVMIERSLAFAAWVPLVALATLVVEAGRKWRPYGMVAALTVGVLVIPSGISMLGSHWEADSLTARLRAEVAPGDVVAVRPAWWAPLAEYGVGVASGRPVVAVTVPGLTDADAFQIGHHPTGRIWVVQRGRVADDLLGRSRCGPDWHDELFTVACLAPT